MIVAVVLMLLVQIQTAQQFIDVKFARYLIVFVVTAIAVIALTLAQMITMIIKVLFRRMLFVLKLFQV